MTDDHRTDDPTIPDSDRLFRRVPQQWVVPENGTVRLSSAAFKDYELSVNVECLMKAQNRLPEDSLKDFPNMYLTSIIAGRVRTYGHKIVKDTAPPHDLAHGVVLGKKTDSFAKAMSREHQWIKAPS